ncbi:MAG TPA: tail fiber domain-containing protein [Thermoanaerobaculia bacterium]|nr:tail fiber domain-containing protein [Thermoanaerobaculia bacterium]
MTSADHEKVVLTVVGPNGAVFQKEFALGTMPSFRLQDLGGRLTDGSYTYELRMVPRISAEAKKQLAAARAAGDDDAVGRIQSAAGINPEALVQSGSLRVINGALVSPDAEEPAVASQPAANSTTSSLSGPKVIKPLDIVQADDVIIQGSLCVGLDCVNNESFGFDTIRLKENNTRIKFDDTSTASGFANHNWQLTANDSASGGANKFSIEDITAATVPVTITGSAPSNSIFVDSTGRMGLRTATPVLDIHVATGNTPAMRLEQNSSGGFTAQTWDVGGNEANFFVRDVTSGSRLPFRIRPGASTSSIDISASGSVGINNASPNSNAKLDINGAIRLPGVIYPTTDNGAWITNESGAGLALQSAGTLRLKTGGTTDRVTIDASGNVGIGTGSPGSQLVIANGGTTSSVNAGATQFTVASSRTFKENIEPIDVPDILAKIESVPVVTYDFRNNGPKDRLGLIAEDFHQIFARGDDKHIDGQEVQMALWMAVQKLTAENKALTERLAKLEGTIAQQKPQP